MASKKKAEKSPEKAKSKAKDSGSTVTLKRKGGETLVCNKGDEGKHSEWLKG